MKLHKTLRLAFAGIALTLGSAGAYAHTIGIGSLASGGTGTADIWMSTYTNNHGSISNEGSISLTLGSTTVSGAFNMLQNPRPAGLIGGDNFFYAECPGGAIFCGGGTDIYTAAINNTGELEQIYQGLTLSGLSAGTWSYTISGMSTVDWANAGNGASGWTGNIVIPPSSVSGIPEPGILALFGLGLLGLGMAKRRRKVL